jgi:putative transposase
MIEPSHSSISTSEQCRLLDLSRASYYRLQDTAVSEKDLAMMNMIDVLYMRYPFYGSRKIRDHLKRDGHKINRKRVQRLMRKMGIASIAPSPGTSMRNKAHPIYPYLLRDIKIDRPNQVWCTDITYIRLKGGFVYLVAIMDWHSRQVLSWEISSSMDSSFCISALERAIRLHGKPEIFNSDQGAQFTSRDFTSVLKKHGIKISMDGKGRWMDNVFIERLWRSVKYEDIYIRDYATVQALRTGLSCYFRFYNTQRPHQSHGGATPSEVYFSDNTLKVAA